jgi:hypothetical protein
LSDRDEDVAVVCEEGPSRRGSFVAGIDHGRILSALHTAKRGVSLIPE